MPSGTKMLINAVEAEEYRVAIVKDGLLEGFYIETAASEQKVGNVYKGVVERIEPSLQACFVNYGGEKNGFLQAGDVHPEYYQKSFEATKEQAHPPIEKILKKGQELLVQVTKEMPGRKGASLTTYLSFASRYLVLMPGSKGGVSRKIEDEEERARLKEIMAQLKIPEDIGCIVRTAAEKQSKRELSRDLGRLLRVWRKIKEEVPEALALSLIHKEQDIGLRTLRDYFTSEISEVLVDDKDTFALVRDYMKIISPRHQRRVKLYKEKEPLFSRYQIEQQIETVYSATVPLKSGGSIVIDPTEALVAVDVNSGRGRGKNVENVAFKANMEAAVEIARQLRLRDMGGLIVIDFIDMRDRKHNRNVEKAFRDETKTDRAKIDMSPISKFGLMELSRQRLNPSIESKSYQTCHYCKGRGLVQSVESAAVSYLRRIWQGAAEEGVSHIKGALPVQVAMYLQNRKRKDLARIEARYRVEIDLQGDPLLAPGDGKLEIVRERKGEPPPTF